ncbi:MAG TPA: hypothetical protein VF027_03105 [Sphingomicrobium sp.]
MMTKIGSIASLLALAIISAPAAASPRDAAFATSGDQPVSRTMMFGGATFRMNLDGKKTSRPEFAMRLTGAVQDRGSAIRFGDGLAFGTAAGGKMRMTLAGQDSRVLGKRLGMSGGATAALIVGGIVLVGGAVLLATQGMGDAASAGFDDDD